MNPKSVPLDGPLGCGGAVAEAGGASNASNEKGRPGGRPFHCRAVVRLNYRKSRKYGGKIEGRPAGTKHRKFASSNARVPNGSRDSAPHGCRPEGKPLGPSRCDDDPDRLPPWPQGQRAVRPEVVASRAAHGSATRPPRQERLAECPSHAR